MYLNRQAIYNYMEGHFRDYYELSSNISITDYFIQYNSVSLIEFTNILQNPDPFWFTFETKKIPVFMYSNADESENMLKFDPFINGFLFLSGLQEYILHERDIHQRFPLVKSLQYRFNFLHLPIVNIYFELLAQHLKKFNIAVQKKSLGTKAKSQIIVTHDIDRLNSGWMEMIGVSLRSKKSTALLPIMKALQQKLFGSYDYYTQALYKLLHFEKQNQIPSVFFFLSNKSKKDGDYDVHSSKMQNIFSDVLKNNASIGLHAGYDTFQNSQEFERQINALEKACPKTSKINRQHFLKFDIRTTPEIFKKLKIKTDYTLGFPNDYGFRNGICGPFHLFDFNNHKSYDCIEIPLFFMDNNFINHRESFNINLFFENLNWINKHFNFKVSILFHNTVFIKIKYHDAAPVFYKLIEYAKVNNLLI